MFKLGLLLICTLSFVLATESLFKALPLSDKTLSPKAKLGKLLFHDPILSKDNTISCATCHPLSNYGVDNLVKSFGVNNALGERNTPTIWNSRYNLSQFWDGRAKDLKEQALMPIVNPIEMNHSIDSVVKKLKNNTLYNQHFNRLYPDGVTPENLADVLARFERQLITPNSKFDRYLNGEESALNKKEKKGLELFKRKGCVACHNGINVGGTLYQKIGIFEDYLPNEKTDLGRYNVTKKNFDKYYFKVPGLRNVAKTAPYFHDGSVATLKESVIIMARLQLGRELPKDEIDSLVAFLETMTGEINDAK